LAEVLAPRKPKGTKEGLKRFRVVPTNIRQKSAKKTGKHEAAHFSSHPPSRQDQRGKKKMMV